jgi:hypothetical protein
MILGIIVLGLLGAMILIGVPVMTRALMKVYEQGKVKNKIVNAPHWQNELTFVGAVIISILTMAMLLLFLIFLINKSRFSFD